MGGNELKGSVLRELLHKSVMKFTKRSDVHLAEDKEVNTDKAELEGLLSSVVRTKTFYTFEGDTEIHTKKFIVKKLPITKFQLDFVMEREIFKREALYYDRVLPIMKRLSVNKLQIPFPECYHVILDGVNDVIVMEDLTEAGFRPANRHCLPDGMDIDHCRLALRCLGRIHGLGLAAERFFSLDGKHWLDVFPSFGKEAWFYLEQPGEKESPAVTMTEKAMTMLLELSADIQGFPMEAKGSGLLEIAVKGAWRTSCRLVEPDCDGVNVPSHGDYYMNNLLFKYEDHRIEGQKPVEVKAIDLQLTRYCHPCIDILFFMYLCTSKSLRDTFFEELLSLYYQSLSETLKDLGEGSPPMSLQQLSSAINGKYKPFGILIAVVAVPNLFLASDSTNLCAEEIFKTGCVSIVRERFEKDVKFKSRLVELIREFVEMAFPNGPNTLDSSPLIA